MAAGRYFFCGGIGSGRFFNWSGFSGGGRFGGLDTCTPGGGFGVVAWAVPAWLGGFSVGTPSPGFSSGFFCGGMGGGRSGGLDCGGDGGGRSGGLDVACSTTGGGLTVRCAPICGPGAFGLGGGFGPRCRSNWGESRLLIKAELGWENKKIGGNTPPIRTRDGWLTLYHAVGSDGHYRLGALLLDLNDPSRVIGRSRDWLLQPEEWYELNGYYPGVCFPCGKVIIDGTLFVYYGGADKYIGLATCQLEELLDDLRRHSA